MECTNCHKDKAHIDFTKQLHGYRQPCSACISEAVRAKRAKDKEVFDQDSGYYDDNTPELLKMMKPTGQP